MNLEALSSPSDRGRWQPPTAHYKWHMLLPPGMSFITSSAPASYKIKFQPNVFMPNLASCATCVFHSGSPYRRKRSKAHTAKQTSPNRLYRRVRATAPAELCYARTASDPDACRRGLSAGTSQPYGRDSSNNGKPISIMQRAARLLESRC